MVRSVSYRLQTVKWTFLSKYDSSLFDQTLDTGDVMCVCVICRVCYERCPINPTAATFMLSAMWHGVYPGYYLTFVTGIAMTMAARAVSTEQNLLPLLH